MSGRSLLTDWNYEHLVAGLSGGFISTLIVHPVDLLKIQFSVHEGKGVKYRPQYNSYWDAGKTIFKKQGLRGLYQGAVPNLLGNTMAWGLYFQFYNIAKNMMKKEHDDVLAAPQHLMAGVISGIGTLTLTNPIWVVKTRLCLQYEGKHSPGAYKSFFDAISRIFKEEGFRALYRGYLPGLIGTSHGALQFMAYEELRKKYCSYTKTPIKQKLGNVEYLVFAALSKFFAVSCTYPYQVVRSRLQDQHVQYNGVRDVIQRTWRGEGVGGFYKGMLASLVRVIPATMITFLVYENVSQFLAAHRTIS